MNNKNHQRTETEKISSSKSDMIENEDIVRQLGFLMRFANRINNNKTPLELTELAIIKIGLWLF